MQAPDRRQFLKLMGAGAAALAAGAMIPSFLSAGWTGGQLLTVRAVGGLPQGALPSFASYVMEGSVDLQAQSGLLRSTVFAGPPEAMSQVELSGASRTIRITQVRRAGNALQLMGSVERGGESGSLAASDVDILVDLGEGIVRAPFREAEVALRLEVG